MPKLTIPASGRTLGDISDTDLRLLQSVLEEEGPDDTDYWIDLDTIDLIASRGGSEHLLAVLRNALTNTPDGVEVGFEKWPAGCYNRGESMPAIPDDNPTGAPSPLEHVVDDETPRREALEWATAELASGRGFDAVSGELVATGWSADDAAEIVEYARQATRPLRGERTRADV